MEGAELRISHACSPASPFLRAFPFLIFLQEVCVSRPYYPYPSNIQDRIPNYRDTKSAKDKPGIVLRTKQTADGMSDPQCLESGPSPTALFNNSHSFTHAQGIPSKIQRCLTVA